MLRRSDAYLLCTAAAYVLCGDVFGLREMMRGCVCVLCSLPTHEESAAELTDTFESGDVTVLLGDCCPSVCMCTLCVSGCVSSADTGSAVLN